MDEIVRHDLVKGGASLDEPAPTGYRAARRRNQQCADRLRQLKKQRAKWGVTKIDALRGGLFNGSPWVPPGIEPELTG